MKKLEARRNAKYLINTGLSNLMMQIDDDLERENGFSEADQKEITNQVENIIIQMISRNRPKGK